MTLGDVHDLMLAIAQSVGDVHVDVNVVDDGRWRSCVMTLRSTADSAQWASVSTSGSGDYELRVNRGFVTGQFDDQSLERSDVREYLESYVRAASAYLAGKYSIRPSGVFRVPTLTISDGASRLTLSPPRRASTNDSRLSF